jgi:histidinol phosphatase-like enzyme
MRATSVQAAFARIFVSNQAGIGQVITSQPDLDTVRKSRAQVLERIFIAVDTMLKQDTYKHA